MGVNIDGVYVPNYGWCRRVSGTAVTKGRAIAGKGTGIPFRDASFYVAQYGGEFGDWQKMRGEMVVDCGGVPTRIEAHWVRGTSFDGIHAKCVRVFR